MKKSLAVLIACCGLLVVPTLASTGVCAPGTSGSKCEIKKEIETLKTGYKQALSAVKGLITGNRDKIQTNRKEFKNNFESVNAYLQKPLTGTNKQAVQLIIKQKQTAMDAIQKQTKQAIQSGTVDWTGYVQKGTQIIQDFQSAILPYIGTGKLDLFSAFIQGRLKLLQANTLIKTQTANLKKEIEDTVKEMKQQIEQKKKELEQKLEQAKKEKELKLEQKKKELELQKEQKKKELEQKGEQAKKDREAAKEQAKKDAELKKQANKK